MTYCVVPLAANAQMNYAEVNPSLAIKFGDLEPQDSVVGRWDMTSSLQGYFKNFNATFECVRDGSAVPNLRFPLVHATPNPRFFMPLFMATCACMAPGTLHRLAIPGCQCWIRLASTRWSMSCVTPCMRMVFRTFSPTTTQTRQDKHQPPPVS